MKRIITLILLLCMVLTLASCGKVEITMQEIYDTSLTDTLLKTTKAYLFATRWTASFGAKHI